MELLAAVAEIDADQTPPCCLEIAQLCGRLPVSIWLLASHALRLTIISVVALLEHSRKFDSDLRDWMGGGDTFCSEEGHEIIDDGQRRGFSAAQPATASDSVRS